MIYRIDFQHFMTHAIDYFTTEELYHFQYAIISAVMKNCGRATNVVKINELYPLPEIVLEYTEYKDKSMMENMYMDYLCPKKDNDMGMTKNQMDNIIYRVFVNTLINHADVVIICDRSENDYIDVLCKLLQKEYKIEVIDLNKLFSEGRIGPIYIDRKEIWDRAVDIRRAAGRDQIKALESTSGGREKLLGMMKKKDKIKKIEELGININSYDMKDLDSILMSAWVNDEEE